MGKGGGGGRPNAAINFSLFDLKGNLKGRRERTSAPITLTVQEKEKKKGGKSCASF